MTLVPEEYILAERTLDEASPIIQSHLPGAQLTSDGFDVRVVHLHGPGDAVTRETAYRIARELRGGRDPDLSIPTDWHVRALRPHLLISDFGNHPQERERIGTTIWFSRTYAIPAGYDETSGGDAPIDPPGCA